MKRLLRLLHDLTVYFCTATVVATVVLVAMLIARGRIDQQTALKTWALLQGVDLPQMEFDATQAAVEEDAQPSYQEALALRAQESRDLDLREMVVDKALRDLKALEQQLRTQRERYDALKQSFDSELSKLEQTAQDTSLSELQATLEAIKPALAREQIVRILADDRTGQSGEGMRDVVTMLKAMPVDKRKKILEEFKSEEDAATLHDILRALREGEPLTSLIRETRESLRGV
jgi:hypothetical protein